MTIDVNSFYTPERFARFKAFAETKDTLSLLSIQKLSTKPTRN